MTAPPLPRAAAVLNFDVLVDILSFMESGAELVPAMCTCRTLYLAGIPLLLRSQVVIRTRAKLISFCRFILRDSPTRFCHLRHLEISVPGKFKTAAKADLLVAMFAHAAYVEQLKIYDCEVLLSDARLPSVLSNLTALRKITLHSLNDAGRAVLDQLDARLVAADICFYGDTVEGPGDPIPLLSRFASCLRELRVTYAEFGQATTHYTSLTSLVVDDCQFAKIEPLIACFPNLRDLSMWMGQEDDELDSEEIEEHRQLNGDSQARSRWNGLDCVRGSILSLYMLHLKCSVQHLDVQSAYLTTDSAYQLAAILADMMPLTLTLRIDTANFDVSHFGELVRPISLTGLTIHLDISDPNLQTVLTIRGLIKSLKGVQARSLVIHPQYVPPTVTGLNSDDDDQLAVSPSTANFCIEETAAESLAALATVALPSLRSFIVDTRSFRLSWEVGPYGLSDNGCSCNSARSLRRILPDVVAY